VRECLKVVFVCVRQLFTSNLVTRSASAEYAAEAERSVADVEHTRLRGIPEREMYDPAERMFVFRLRL